MRLHGLAAVSVILLSLVAGCGNVTLGPGATAQKSQPTSNTTLPQHNGSVQTEVPLRPWKIVLASPTYLVQGTITKVNSSDNNQLIDSLELKIQKYIHDKGVSNENSVPFPPGSTAVIFFDHLIPTRGPFYAGPNAGYRVVLRIQEFSNRKIKDFWATNYQGYYYDVGKSQFTNIEGNTLATTQ